MENNDLSSLVESTVRKLKTSSSEEEDSLLSKLRKAIIEAPLAEALAKEVKANYDALGSDRVAVRSSATAEDLPGYSFAGQHDTYFASGLDDCLEKIKHCWASLWTVRAFEYRKRNGFDQLGVEMAVIVQELVPAEVSGVLFTADPVTGKHDRLVIESCYGLGEALVSGKVSPDRTVLAKDDLRVLEHKVSDKKVEVVIDETGVVHEQKIKPPRFRSASLDQTLARQLGELAKKAESAFSQPQDIEWAVSEGDVFFLQSRPITTIKKEKTFEDRQVWSNLNTGEILPDVVSPMTWSALEKLVEPIFQTLFGRLGIDLGDNPLIGQVAGRVYFNLTTLLGAVKSIPGLKKADLSTLLGGEQDRMEELGRLKILDEDLPDLKFSPLRLMVRLPGIIFSVLAYSPKKGVKFITRMSRRGEQLLALDFSALSDEALLSHLQQTCEEMSEHIHGLGFAFQGMVGFSQLDKVCCAWLDDDEGTFANRLLAGMGGVESAEAGLMLWELADRARENSGVAEIILADGKWQEVQEKLAALRGGREFLDQWDGFMSKHGHHTRGELDICNPRWSDDPDYILRVIRNYSRNWGKTDPIEHYQQRRREREELTRQCRTRLKNPVKRVIFNLLLSRAQLGSVVRENLKNTAIKYWINGLRRIALELGGRLASRGVLEEKDDIFFLRFDEFEPVVLGQAEFDVKSVVAERKAEYAKNQQIVPPAVVGGRFDPKTYIPAEQVKPEKKILSGLAVSPGVATGLARVILRACDDEQVLPGEILVTPFTDPGWTPYFIPAAAIVMDQGGLLSHGSIIAREYGIPAVVNVGPATKLIKTGQTIQVDGNRGLVEIVEAKLKRSE